jgi:hypothetical protein
MCQPLFLEYGLAIKLGEQYHEKGPRWSWAKNQMGNVN